MVISSEPTLPVQQQPLDPVSVRRQQRQERLRYVDQTLQDVVAYVGLAAVGTAIAAIACAFRCEHSKKDKDGNTNTKQLSDYIGDIYVVTEVVLIVAVISLVGFKIFEKYN